MLGISFFFLSNVDIKFANIKKLTQIIYITAKAIFTAKQVELIDKYKFFKVALDENSEIFIVYVEVSKTLLKLV